MNPVINYVLKYTVHKTNRLEEFGNTVCRFEHPSCMRQLQWFLRRKRTAYTASIVARDSSESHGLEEHLHHRLSSCNVHFLVLVVLMKMSRNFQKIRLLFIVYQLTGKLYYHKNYQEISITKYVYKNRITDIGSKRASIIQIYAQRNMWTHWYLVEC